MIINKLTQTGQQQHTYQIQISKAQKTYKHRNNKNNSSVSVHAHTCVPVQIRDTLTKIHHCGYGFRYVQMNKNCHDDKSIKCIKM